MPVFRPPDGHHSRRIGVSPLGRGVFGWGRSNERRILIISPADYWGTRQQQRQLVGCAGNRLACGVPLPLPSKASHMSLSRDVP